MTADPRARRVLREYRNATAMPPTARDALWDRIDRSIDEGAVLEPPVEAAGEPPRRAAAWLAVVLGSSAVLAVGLVPRLWPSPEPPVPTASSEHVPEQDAPSPPRPGAPPSPPEPMAAEVPAPAVAQPVLTPRPARPATPAPATEAQMPASDDALREEMRLIARARASMQQHRPSAALEVLEEHLRRFASGQMREDRAVLRIEALCAIGKRRQANIEADAFTRSFPASAHLARVQGACPPGQSVPAQAGK